MNSSADWKHKGRTILTGLFVALIGYIGIKSLIFSLWEAPSEQTYAAVESGRAFQVVFMPKNRALVVYVESEPLHIEAVRTHLRGTRATHYFGPIWSVHQGGLVTPFDFRWYPADSEPVVAESEVEARYVNGTDRGLLPEVGSKIVSTLRFHGDKLEYAGQSLTRVANDPEFTASISAALSK